MASRQPMQRLRDLEAPAIPTVSRPRISIPSLPDNKEEAWRWLTSPYWLASDVPAPHWPKRSRSLTAGGEAGQVLLESVDTIRSRLWLNWMANFVVRAFTLAFLIGLVWLLVDWQGGPAPSAKPIVGVAVILSICGLLLGLTSKPDRSSTGSMLDRSFKLKERLTTALEHIGEPGPDVTGAPTLVYLQIADAANIAAELKKHPAVSLRMPIREVATAITLGLLFTTLYFLRGTEGGQIEVAQQPVPVFVSAAERFVQQQSAVAAPAVGDESSAQAGDEGDASAEAQNTLQDLAAISSALDNQAITKSISDAIDKGNYEDAANGLQSLAGNSSSLSDDAKQALGQDLQQAADSMSDPSSPLAQSARQAGEGLTGDDQSAKEGLNNLAQSVQQAGDSLSSESSSAESGDQSSGDEQSQSGQSQDNGGTAGSQGDSSDNGGSSGGQDTDQQHNTSGDASASDPQEGADSSDTSASGASQSQQGSSSGSSGDQPGSGNQSGQANEGGGQSDQPGAAGEGQGENPQQGEGSGTGNGAGASDDSANQDPNGGTGSGGDGTTDEANSDPSQSTNAQTGDSATGKGTGASGDTQENVELDQSGSGESVELGGSGGSKLGDGAGATVSGGNLEQGVVGNSGPDSNHVPPEYRSIVENYFTDPDSSEGGG